MSAVSDAFAAFQTALVNKLQSGGSGGPYLPLTGGRITGQLEVEGDILATGDCEGQRTLDEPYPDQNP